MIPLGYMLKRVVRPPEWMNAPDVEQVYSVSNCVSHDFTNFIPLWKHNGWWFFNSPETVRKAAAEKAVDLTELTLFYYEAFEQEYDEDGKAWRTIAPEPDFETAVTIPVSKVFHGYDVVTFTVHTSPECSPLSCNSLAAKLATNRFCLLDDFDSARKLLESGAFDDSEPGPFRIIAVYTPLQQEGLS